jgi:hypothetical protein
MAGRRGWLPSAPPFLEPLWLFRSGRDPESLERLLPDRWALANPEHVLSYRLEESRQKAKRRDERRAMRRRGSK